MWGKRLLVAVLVATSLLATVGATGAQARTTRGRILAKVNAIRVNHGVRRLDCVSSVNDLAQSHSRRMASTGTLFHTPDLYSKLRSRIRLSAWGENVGYAPRWRRVVKMWMNSPSHRHNMLNGRFARCGIGAVRSGARIWLTMIFVG
jgi:uncharacterized protein YkwD